MNNRKLYVCVSCGNPDTYLTFYGEETTDIKLAAKCVSRSCAKIILADYKKNHKKQRTYFFAVKEYIED